MELKGKHVLITGAGKRVARVIAERLLSEGVRLSAHYFQSRASVLELVGPNVFPVQADLRKVADIRRAASQAMDHFGPVDILINSASNFYPTPVLETTEAQWEDLMSVNLKGPFFLSQAVAPKMLEKGGVIINIADVNGTRPMKTFTPYVTAKAGLLMLTKNLAKEWAPRVRVNAISPGPVLQPENYTEAQIQRSADRTLLKRWGAPEDIANATVFLITNDYMTGYDLKVDGGRSLV